MKPVVIICSRLESSRLPRKAFYPLAGKPAIEHILSRVCGNGLPVTVAVPEAQAGVYKAALRQYDATVFGGDPNSPLHRMAACSKGFDWIVRITHDDTIIDWQTVKLMLAWADKYADETTGYIRCGSIIEGAGVEIIHTDNLTAAAKKRKEPTEFVSYFVRGDGLPRPHTYEVTPRPQINRPFYRLTMDYPQDAQLLDIVLRQCGTGASTDKIVAYLDRHPNLLNINRLPFISFYTCAKDAEKWIGGAVSSVLRCGIQDFEYVVVDDGSDDETVHTVAQYLTDPRLRLIVNPENVGLASSSNIALKNCRGRYVMRVDADDRLSGDFLAGFSEMVAAMNLGADVVYPAYATIDERGRVIRPKNDPRQHRHIGCALVRKRTIDEIRFRDGLRNWDGFELVTRLERSGRRLEYIDTVTWHYRTTTGSMSRTNSTARESLRAEILEGNA